MFPHEFGVNTVHDTVYEGVVSLPTPPLEQHSPRSQDPQPFTGHFGIRSSPAIFEAIFFERLRDVMGMKEIVIEL